MSLFSIAIKGRQIPEHVLGFNRSTASHGRCFLALYSHSEWTRGPCSHRNQLTGLTWGGPDVHSAQSNHNTALLKSFWSESNVTALLKVTLHSGLLSSFCLQGLSLSHLECDSPTVAASGSGDIICLLFSFWFPPLPPPNPNPPTYSNHTMEHRAHVTVNSKAIRLIIIAWMMKKKWHLYELNNKLSFEHKNLRLENQPSTRAHLRRKIHKVI